MIYDDLLKETPLPAREELLPLPSFADTPQAEVPAE